MTTSFEQLGVDAALVKALSAQWHRPGLPDPGAEPSPTPLPDATSAARPRPARARRSPSASRSSRRVTKAEPRRPRALVLVPTRELATQVPDELQPLGARPSTCASRPSTAGPTWSGRSRSWPQGSDVVVATPGRMIDLIERGEACARRRRDRRGRRGRPHGRHGLPAPGRVAAAPHRRHPPDAAVLGHPRRRGQDPRRPLPDRPGPPRGRVGPGDRRGDDPPLPASSTRWTRPRSPRPSAGPRPAPSCSPAPSAAPTAWSASSRPRASRPAPSTATCARACASRRWPTSRRQAARCWWPPTWPPGASTSTTSTW